MALDLIAGAAFGALYDRVSRAVDKKVALKDSLKDMKRTLESLRGQAGIIRGIREFNEELSLPNDGIDDLETQMIEGEKLICRLSCFGIYTYCCTSGCAEQLDELNRCLERLLETLMLQQARDVKEILKGSRQTRDDVDEIRQMMKKILLHIEGDSVESPASETTTENEENGEEQVASLEGRVEAAFLALFGIVLEVKDKNATYRPLLGSIKSSLDCLKPLIEDLAQGNRVLDRPVKELEYFRMHMEKGAELVRKCSKNGVCAKYKKKKYTNQLLELDACLQMQFNVLRAQVARDVRETTASIKSIQKVIKRIEESGVMKNQMEMNGPCEVVEASSPDEKNEGLVEPSSPDEQNEGLVEPSSPDEQNEGLVSVGKMEASDIRVEGSGEVQEKSEVPNCFEVPEPPLFTVGLDVALKEMKMKLLEDGFSKIVVWGVGGVGKTTLVKMLCHDQEVKDKFKKIFFTTASKWQNLNLIMQELYRVLCSQVPTFQNKEGRRYLVVLDDVGDGSESILPEFDGLKIPNSKILITSRYAFPGVGSQYHLKSLNDEDAMSLFHHSASLGDRCSYIPEDLLRKIVECCKGLPLAITVNGRSLCGQPIEIWQKRIVEWGRGSSIFDTEPEMIVCLQRSLDALRREKTIIKECFVDLASFPEDQVIPAAALIDMWAELYGLHEEYWSIANLQKLTIRGFANIVSREEEMEVDGYYSDLFVTLHHMLRGLAIHEASEDTIEQRNRLIIDIHGDTLPSWWTEQKYQPRNARLLSVSTDRAFSRKWHYMQVPKVEVLVLNFQTEKYELPDFLDKIDKLKVLVVTNYGSSSARLSNFQLVGSLRNLKRIRLEGVSITSITKNPIQLDSLKKIAFTKCDMGQAFSNSSFQFAVAFPNLVEMYVEHCHDLKELPADLGNLSHLETLSISNCHRLSTLPEGIGNLSKLKRLRVRYGTNLVKFPGSIRKLNSLEFLDISGCIKIMGFPEDIGEMSRLRKLNISGCSRLKELPLSVLSLEQLQEVIMDEETEKSWNPFLLKNIDTRVVPPLTVGFDVALEELNCQVLKDRMSRRVECGVAQNKIQTEGWCPVPVPSSLTMGLDVLDVWGAMKMDEKLTSEVRVKQIEGSDVVKKQLGIKGISGNHSRNNIVSNASSSAGGSQLLKAAETDESQTDEQSLETFVLRRFNFEELNVATGNFRSDGIIGRGPFGNIFKGWVDEKTLAPSKVGSGMPVAVKKLNPERVLDFEEWQSELNFRGRTSHPNVVKLLGYCREEKEMLFVYEYMPNGSLEDHFYRRSPGIETLPWNYRLDAAFGMEPLSWNKRLDIASGVAQALAYLHTFSPNQIVHSDLKASNILLDWNYNAKLSNFGLERLGKTGVLSHQSTRFVGTSLYIDPKEITTGHSYVKSNVYRFGVTLLQLLTGLKTTDRNRPSEWQNLGLKTTDRNCPSERQNLVEWGKPLLLNERNLKTIMDVRIEGQYSSKAAFRAAQLTLKCLALDPKSRPSMTEVVEELEQIQAIEERIKQSENTSMPSSECRRNIDSNTSSGGGTSVFSEGKTSTFQSKDDDQSIDGHISETSNLRVFSFAELKTSTRNFRADTMVGEGGFGTVFKGWLDETTLSPSKAGTGMMVAIKKLKAESFQGFKEWQSEVNFVGRLSHPNLVKLLGYCWEDKELLLVYEFMPKGSLEYHLFRWNPNTESLSWEIRIKIAIGVAQGLAYMHSLEKQVIYRDFKTSNILLDGNYNAKLSDFGLAKLGPTGGDSHVSTRVMGTYGYAAPEYIVTGHLYVKSDVYSFGVVLLELLTGLRALDTKRPKEQLNLVNWANPLLSNKRNLKTIVDVRIDGQYSSKAACQAAQLTLKCLALDSESRPSMTEVVEELEQIQAIEERIKQSENTSMPSSERRRNIDLDSSSGGGTSLFSELKTSTFRSKDDDQSIDGHISETSNLRVFSFAELKTATRNFRADTMLGEGGFGTVFKGRLDETMLSPSKAGTGMMVAIKKLKAESFQSFKEWQSEVNFVGRLFHPNLVKLLGYCWEDKELLLVYEFMPKGSLEYHLFRWNPNIESLSWEIRIKIAIGVARGLAYLHSLEKQVIYRDFKTSNILLDVNYNAKLSDFGLAKLGPTGGDSHVSTRVMGTYGYAAPEYIVTGHLYVKSDVYGFGVVLLELLTGLRALDPKRPQGQVNLVEWAKPLLSNKRKLKTIIDAQMEGQYSLKAASRAGQITLKCLAPDPKIRPPMKEVVEELEQIRAIKE